MKAGSSLPARVEQFLTERRRLGFTVHSSTWSLRSFVRHARAVGHRGPLTLEVMIDWARRDSHGSDDPLTWARRLQRLHSFTRWLRQFEPRTEIPDSTIFGRASERLAPHICSERELVELLAAARRLGPASTLRGGVYEALFGLIASCGLRIGEALALRNEDVDFRRGMLTVRKAKFGKSRQVPMHPSTVEALRRYRKTCNQAGESTAPDAAFFIGTRGRRHGLPLGDRQVHRVFVALHQQLGWPNRGTHHAPRIHDLRHTFVVRRITAWQAQGVDIDQAMLSLSTYLGHTEIGNTYWYLSAVPELMTVAADRFASFVAPSEVSHA